MAKIPEKNLVNSFYHSKARMLVTGEITIEDLRKDLYLIDNYYRERAWYEFSKAFSDLIDNGNSNSKLKNESPNLGAFKISSNILPKVSFGNMLRRFRKARRLSGYQVSTKVGCHPQNYYLWEQGKRHPTGQSLDRLCSVLKLDSEEKETLYKLADIELPKK